MLVVSTSANCNRTVGLLLADFRLTRWRSHSAEGDPQWTYTWGTIGEVSALVPWSALQVQSALAAT